MSETSKDKLNFFLVRGRDPREIENQQCLFCASKVNGVDSFDDGLSAVEFTLSHLCQKCQDEVFANPRKGVK